MTTRTPPTDHLIAVACTTFADASGDAADPLADLDASLDRATAAVRTAYQAAHPAHQRELLTAMCETFAIAAVKTWIELHAPGERCRDCGDPLPPRRPGARGPRPTRCPTCQDRAHNAASKRWYRRQAADEGGAEA